MAAPVLPLGILCWPAISFSNPHNYAQTRIFRKWTIMSRKFRSTIAEYLSPSFNIQLRRCNNYSYSRGGFLQLKPNIVAQPEFRKKGPSTLTFFFIRKKNVFQMQPSPGCVYRKLLIRLLTIYLLLIQVLMPISSFREWLYDAIMPRE